ncbi:MAG: ATP-binding cassette domain-containing protein [Alphaproteobacteria bacterium]
MGSVVAFSGVTKRFGDFTAVDDLSFAVEAGSITGFLGPNGAGKTTSLRLMLAMLKPDAGEIRVFGRAAPQQARSRTGYLPEERGLSRRLRALTAIVYVASLKGMPVARARRRALELLERFGLSDFARVRIDGLSKGMAQKVQIITTIVHDPDLVILDEPFSGLDPVNQIDLHAFVRELAAGGKTVLFSTHTMEHAERLCDRLIILGKGKKLFEGDLDEARALLPRRALVAATADLSFLAAIPGVTLLSRAGPGGVWEFALADSVAEEALLRACFEREIVPTRFSIVRPNLHDVFVSLVGVEAGNAP